MKYTSIFAVCGFIVAIAIMYAHAEYDPGYYDLSGTLQQDTGIVVLCYNRPNYFKKVVEALAANPEAAYLPFIFILDGGPNATQDQNRMIIEQEVRIQNKFIIARDCNYGCGRSLIDARRFMFEWCGFKKIIVFEDDLVVAPQYISLVLKLYNWAQQYNNVGVVQGFSYCTLPLTQKVNHLKKVKESRNNFWGYCIDQEVYYAIKPILDEHEKLHLMRTPKASRNKVGRWMEQKLKEIKPRVRKNKLPSTIAYRKFLELVVSRYKGEKNIPRDGQDYEMRLALFLAGYIKIVTEVNRACYIGKKGVHHNKQIWKEKGFGNMKLDVFESDEYVQTFKYISQGLPNKNILSQEVEEANIEEY